MTNMQPIRTRKLDNFVEDDDDDDDDDGDDDDNDDEYIISLIQRKIDTRYTTYPKIVIKSNTSLLFMSQKGKEVFGVVSFISFYIGFITAKKVWPAVWE